MRHPFALLLITLVAAVGLCASPASAAKRRVPVGWLGVNVDGPMLAPGFDPASEFGAMVPAGVETVRAPVFWSQVEPSPGALDFSGLDRVIGDAAARGLRTLPTVLRTPAWAAERPSDSASPPRDPGTYATFLRALIARYGPGGAFWRSRPDLPGIPVRAWQVWNEPGQPYYWTDRPFPASYVRLLRVAHDAIKAADPRATVVLAALNSGVGYRSWTDLDRVYRAGGRRLFDQAAVNPFTLKTANVVKTIRLFRDVMRRRGDRRKPLLVSELSWPSGRGRTRYGFEVPERTQARRVAEALPALAGVRRSLGIAAVYWYTWLSPATGTDSFDYAGLRRLGPGGDVDKPALRAFRAAARALEGCAKRSRADRCG